MSIKYVLESKHVTIDDVWQPVSVSNSLGDLTLLVGNISGIRKWTVGDGMIVRKSECGNLRVIKLPFIGEDKGASA